MESVIYGLGDLFSLKILMAGDNLEEMQKKNLFVYIKIQATQPLSTKPRNQREVAEDALKLTQPRFVNRSTFGRLMPYFKKD